MTKKLIKPIILSLLVLIIAFIVITYISSRKKSKYTPRETYDKTGFVDYSETLEGKSYKLTNSRYTFSLDASTTQFTIFDELTRQTWLSSGSEVDDLENISEYNELFTIYYERLLETPKSVSITNESIIHDQYSFKVNDSYIDVLYKVGGKRNYTIVDLPRKIEQEKFDTLIAEPLDKQVAEGTLKRLDVKFLKDQYQFIANENAYHLKGVTAQNAIDLIYDLIFDKSDYTQQDYLDDNTKFGFPTTEEVAYFEFVIRYELSDKGLKTTIINDSIYETEKYQIAYIDVLPYFGVGLLNDTGFTVIPDGTGIYIDHNNGKYNTTTYDKRIYGTDLSVSQQMIEKPENQGIIKLPMYAYSKNNFGFINAVESGDSMTNIVSTFKTKVSNDVLVSKIPVTYYRYNLRERDSFNFESNTQSQAVYMWTRDYNILDFTAHYLFSEKADTYYDFVEDYQEYLDSKFEFKDLNNDNMHITLLGGYKEKKNFLGIPYNSVNSLTKVKQINEILNSLDISKYSVSFQGWSNDGIKPNYMNKIKYNNKVGSKSEITKLIKEFSDKNIDLYLEFALNTAHTNEGISVKKNIKKNILDEQVGYYKYDLVTNQFDSTTMRKYQLNQKTTNDLYLSTFKNLNKLKINNIAIMDDGQRLASDYTTKDSLFRYEQINNFNSNIAVMSDKNILLRNSNLYSMPSANKILDMGYSATLHRMADYSIPFLQLTLNGLTNYYSESINLDTSNSIQWHTLKAIETGSKMQFTLSYEDTVKLAHTEYSYIYSTKYLNWTNEIESMSSYLNDLGIYDSYITNHKVLNASGDKVEVKYSNGKVFIIDYTTETINIQEGL